MSERYAVATGNWSDTATWDGSTLPATTDDVYANGFVVTIDSNRTAATVRNTAGSTAVAGGHFIEPDGVTLTALVVCGPESCITYAGTTSAAIIGNIAGSATTGVLGALSKSGAGTVTITGDVTGGGQSNAYAIFQTAGALIVNGNILGGSASGAMGIRHTPTTGSVTVNGDSTAGTALNAHGVYTGGEAPIVINGVIIGSGHGAGGSTNLAYAVHGDGTGVNSPNITARAARDGAKGMPAYGCPVTFQNLATATHKVYRSDGASTTLDAPGGGGSPSLTGGINQ